MFRARNVTGWLFLRNQNPSRPDGWVFMAEFLAGLSGGCVCVGGDVWLNLGKGWGTQGHILVVLCSWRSQWRSGSGRRSSAGDGLTGSAPCVERGSISRCQGAGKTSPPRWLSLKKGPTEAMSSNRVLNEPLDRSGSGPASLCVKEGV